MSIETSQFKETFSDISSLVGPKSLETLVASLEEVQTPAGEALVEYGQPSDKLYFVTEGKLEVSLKSGGANVGLGEVIGGQIVGEISLIEPGPASATVKALAATTAVALSQKGFEDFAASYPADAAMLLKELSKRIARRTRAATASLIERDESGKLVLDRPAEEHKNRLVQLMSTLFGIGDSK